ncbi:MAG: 30S ribosomal protein S8 [Candidatus Wildermuthbacteria bacterium]|nr:30S ribosomal protein S8 [Candidatus Wildermuthbacteria bacterium]
MVDPIADMLNRIQNAQAVQKETVEVPFSQLKYGIAKILEHTGFVKKVDFKGRKVKKLIEIHLKYDKAGVPNITGVKKVSRPGQRIYAAAAELRGVRSGHGVVVVSTPKGLMTYREAKKQNVGGEVLCEVW